MRKFTLFALILLALSVSLAPAWSGFNAVVPTTNASLLTSGTLPTARLSNPLVIDITGNVSGSSGTCTGLAGSATVLASARTINGQSFNGSSNIANTFIGGGTFAGNGGYTTITHGQTLTNGSYEVAIRPAGIAAGTVGEWSVPDNYITQTTFRVYNTGSSTGRFGYAIIDND